MNDMSLNAQWRNRPADQRFLSVEELHASVKARRAQSTTALRAPRDLRVIPRQEGGLQVRTSVLGGEKVLDVNHWSFGQLAGLASAPAGYLRRIDPQLAAINVQWGLEHNPQRDEALLYLNDETNVLQASTSPTYGRIYDVDVVEAVQQVNHDGRWVIPSATYQARDPRKASTLYASDRDVWMFLCDPKNPIDVDGDVLFRGFMVWNSEVGSTTFGIKTFLYRRVCDNRIIWGMQGAKELTIRHTGGAPDRFRNEGEAMLLEYANSSAHELEVAIGKAKDLDLAKNDNDMQEWLQNRGFAPSTAIAAVETANAEEGKARSLWDIVQGLTAHARKMTHTDERVELETKAGRLLNMVGA